MDGDLSDIPNDIEALKAALIAERGRRITAEADAAAAKAKVSSAEALIAHMKLQIAKLRREFYGTRSERTARLIDQMELQLEELETSASEDDLAAEQASEPAGTTQVSSFTRKRPARKPFPEHLPRERVIVPGPTACACCGSSRPPWSLRLWPWDRSSPWRSSRIAVSGRKRPRSRFRGRR